MAEATYDFITNAQKVLNQVKTVVVGKNKTLLWVFAAILARGHVLMEDIPGVGKTTMALAFSKTLGLPYQMLCAKELELRHPITGEELVLKSKMDTQI